MATSQSQTHEHDRESTGTMERVTFRIPERQIEDVEQLVNSGEFPNRSEAIRAAISDLLDD